MMSSAQLDWQDRGSEFIHGPFAGHQQRSEPSLRN